MWFSVFFLKITCLGVVTAEMFQNSHKQDANKIPSNRMDVMQKMTETFDEVGGFDFVTSCVCVCVYVYICVCVYIKTAGFTLIRNLDGVPTPYQEFYCTSFLQESDLIFSQDKFGVVMTYFSIRLVFFYK